MTFNQPGPWIDYASPDPEPWQHNGGVVKLIEFPVRIAAMSRRAFQLYWMRHHSPHVMNVTAFAQYMRKYNTGLAYLDPVPGLPPHYRQNTPFDGASEVWLNSLDEVGAWLSSPVYAELIQPDEPRFISQAGLGELLIGREERLYEPEPDQHESGLTKVYVMVRARAGSDHDARHVGISRLAKRLLESPALKNQLRKLVVTHKLRPPLPEGFPLADIDAVIELWFDDRPSIATFFGAAEYRALAGEEAAVIDAASIRALVARMHVVHDEFSFQPSTTQPIPFRWEK